MAKVTVEVTGAFVDGNAPGTQISIDGKSAKHLEQIGYVKIVPKKAAPKKQAAEGSKKTGKGEKADKSDK